MLVIDVLINVVNADEGIMELIVSVSWSACVRSVDLLVDTLAGMLTVGVMGALTGIGVDVLLDVNLNVFAAVMTEEKFSMSAPFEGCSC